MSEENQNLTWNPVVEATFNGERWQLGKLVRVDEAGEPVRFYSGAKKVDTGVVSYFEYTGVETRDDGKQELVGVALHSLPQGAGPQLHELPEIIRSAMVESLEALMQANDVVLNSALKETLTLPNDVLQEKVEGARSRGEIGTPDAESESKKPQLYKAQYTQKPDSALDKEEVELFAALSDEIDVEAAKLAREHFREIASRQFFLKHDRDANEALDAASHYDDAVTNPPSDAKRSWAQAEEARNEKRAAGQER